MRKLRSNVWQTCMRSVDSPIPWGFGAFAGLIGGGQFSIALRAPELVEVAIPLFATSGMLIGGACAAISVVAPWKFPSCKLRFKAILDRAYFIVLTVAAVTILVRVLLPEIAEARDRARMSRCKNNLWTHSAGLHRDVVYLDGNAQITRVSSCPLCSAHGAPVRFAFESDAARQAALAGHHFLSWETVLDANRRLERIHSSPEFQGFRDWPGPVQRIWDENGDFIQGEPDD